MSETKASGAAGIQRRSAGIQSIEIGMRLLDVFGGSGSALSLKQVSEAAGMAPSKVHRYLVSLVRSGMLIQLGPNGQYDLGPNARRLGLTAMGRLDPFAIASKHLLQLRDDTGHTVCLTVWGDSGATLVRWESGATPLPVSLRVGSSIPLADSAIGRLFLAHVPRLVTEPVLKRQSSAVPHARKGAIAEDELAKLRRQPSLHLASAMIAGIDAVAAPVFDSLGSLSSVICLLAPHHAMAGAARKRIRLQVEQAAQRVSWELGHRSAG